MRLAWLNRTPIAMASGRINRNVPCRAGGLGGITPIRVWSLSKSVRRHSSTECHRTTRANIRSHLDGGPQGWNPHFFGPDCCLEATIKASSFVGEPVPPGPCRQGFDVPDRTSFAFIPSALLHLRASDRYRIEPHDASDLRVHSERPVTLKGVGTGAFVRGHRP